jgi:hypothetical protein
MINNYRRTSNHSRYEMDNQRQKENWTKSRILSHDKNRAPDKPRVCGGHKTHNYGQNASEWQERLTLKRPSAAPPSFAASPVPLCNAPFPPALLGPAPLAQAF